MLSSLIFSFPFWIFSYIMLFHSWFYFHSLCKFYRGQVSLLCLCTFSSTHFSCIPMFVLLTLTGTVKVTLATVILLMHWMFVYLTIFVYESVLCVKNIYSDTIAYWWIINRGFIVLDCHRLVAYFFFPPVSPAPALNLKNMMSPSSTW